jgi:hypothetical protein
MLSSELGSWLFRAILMREWRREKGEGGRRKAGVGFHSIPA